VADDALVEANLPLDVFEALRLDFEVIEGIEPVTEIGAFVADRIGEAAPASG